MIFLNIYESMAEGLANIFELISSWNWVDISTQIKNWVLSASGLTVVALFIKVAIPFFRNSNKPILKKIAVLSDKVESMEKADQNIGNILTEWIGLQSDVNATSRTLTPEQKEAFVQLSYRMKLASNPETIAAGEKIQEIVEDGVVTIDEVKDLVASTKIGEKVLGTNINSIGN